MRPNRVINCILHVFLLSLPGNEEGSEMAAMLKRFQSKPLLPEKPLKAYLSLFLTPISCVEHPSS